MTRNCVSFVGTTSGTDTCCPHQESPTKDRSLTIATARDDGGCVKKAGDLMRELGFRNDAPESTARAFLENLVRTSDRDPRGTGAPSSKQVSTIEQVKALQQPQQLSFDLGDAYQGSRQESIRPRRRRQG